MSDFMEERMGKKNTENEDRNSKELSGFGFIQLKQWWIYSTCILLFKQYYDPKIVTSAEVFFCKKGFSGKTFLISLILDQWWSLMNYQCYINPLEAQL